MEAICILAGLYITDLFRCTLPKKEMILSAGRRVPLNTLQHTIGMVTYFNYIMFLQLRR